MAARRNIQYVFEKPHLANVHKAKIGRFGQSTTGLAYKSAFGVKQRHTIANSDLSWQPVSRNTFVIQRFLLTVFFRTPFTLYDYL